MAWRELEPSVVDHVRWDAKSADPVGEEGAGDRVGIDGGEGHSFQPPRAAFDHGEQVAAPVALGKGAHQMEVFAVEAACWRG